jgi:hypothetical protein
MFDCEEAYVTTDRPICSETFLNGEENLGSRIGGLDTPEDVVFGREFFHNTRHRMGTQDFNGDVCFIRVAM